MVQEPHILDLLAFRREILYVYSLLAGERIEWVESSLGQPERRTDHNPVSVAVPIDPGK